MWLRQTLRRGISFVDDSTDAVAWLNVHPLTQLQVRSHERRHPVDSVDVTIGHSRLRVRLDLLALMPLSSLRRLHSSSPL
jgi:hypothetical protein